jgi:hypothetical protein
MKNLLLTLAVFFGLLLIGCQENSITDPVSTEFSNKSQTAGNNITSGTIPLGDLLVLPGGFQTYYTIEGQIDYTHELFLLDPIPPAPQYYIEVNLSIRAKLSNGVDKLYISTTSIDKIYVSEEGIVILEKVYPVLGGNNGLLFICRYLVTTDGLGLNEMFLKDSYDDPTL